MAALLERVGAALAGVRSLPRGVAAIVEAYSGFAREEQTAMVFIHPSAYGSFCRRTRR